MLDATAKKLLHLLRPEQPVDLRCAAARVLGEIGSKDAEVAQVLCHTLDDPDPDVRAQVMAAAGKLRIERALPQLLDRASGGGPETETAAQAAARLGTKGIRALRTLMGQVAPGLRRRIAAAMAAGGTTDAEVAAVDALLDSDPGVVDAAARTLIAEVPSLGKSQRRALADHLLELHGAKKKSQLPLASETALLRLLAALNDPRGEAVFWARMGPSHPPDLRATALQALGTRPAPAETSKLRRLFACAADTDFRVAAPALMILKTTPLGAKAWKEWLALLDAPDVAVRRFAIEKLGSKDTPEVAAALLRQLRQPDQALRDQALACLARLERGRETLAKQLLEADSADQAWTLARAQAPFVEEYAPALRARLFTQACTYLETEDRRADALLFALREADAHDLRDRLAERARALRKKKQVATALIYLRLLGRDPTCGEALRFELAACGLKVSGHDLAAEPRASDPCLHQFARLVHSHETDPIAYVERAKWLEPEDLFYLGFHFFEGKGPEKEFGGRLLHLLIKRSPRSKLAKDAKSKLRSADLA